MTQTEVGATVTQAAMQRAVPGGCIGTGTGSTVKQLINALAACQMAAPECRRWPTPKAGAGGTRATGVLADWQPAVD